MCFWADAFEGGVGLEEGGSGSVLVEASLASVGCRCLGMCVPVEGGVAAVGCGWVPWGRYCCSSNLS